MTRQAKKRKKYLEQKFNQERILSKQECDELLMLYDISIKQYEKVCERLKIVVLVLLSLAGLLTIIAVAMR